MGKYLIRDLERLSNIKAHTLRVWEQRYGIISPKRSATNIRYYDDKDLQLVLNISFLNRNGHKISKISKMAPSEISEKVRKISASNLEFPNQVNALVIAMVNLDEERFEKIISTNTLQFGFENTMLKIVYPFLARIGILWQTGSINPAHEHFITSLIRQKLIVAIDGQISPPNPQAKRYVLFLPEGELHELSLLFAAYLIKSRHNKVIYLGQNLPLKDLELILELYKPDYLVSIITSYPSGDELNSFLQKMKNMCTHEQVILSGYQIINQLDSIPEEFTVFKQIESLIEFVDTHSAKPFSAMNANGIGTGNGNGTGNGSLI
ncbi:MAG: MerR family transcriptional regulator [Bacteroidia bacterium]|nr:MerR family transcriptional regulator [Bacteroidia bacterium]